MADDGFKSNKAGRKTRCKTCGKAGSKNRNEKYINRGRMLVLHFDDKWEAEVKKANRGKVGAPFKYAESLIVKLAFMRMLGKLPFNELVGLAKEMIGDKNIPCSSALWERINQIKIEDYAGAFVVTADSGKTRMAVDASGLKQHNNGSWIEKKWKVRRGFVKIHIMIDVDTKKILAFKITDETVGDSTVFDELLKSTLKVIGTVPKASMDEEIEKKEAIRMTRVFAKDAVKDAIAEASNGAPEAASLDPVVVGRAVEKLAKGAVSDITYEPPHVLYGDAAYGSRDNVKAVKDAGLASGIALKKSCTTKGKGRGDSWSEAVRDQLGAGEKYVADIGVEDKEANREEWKKMIAYGLRWIVEIVFSAFKRIFGESVRALRRDNIIQEVRLKVAVYNKLIDMESTCTC